MNKLIEFGDNIPFAPSLDILLNPELLRPEMRKRATIAEGIRLSIPLIKHSPNPNNPLISDHGRWREVHLGAWNASYGRTPYFVHLFPLLEEIYKRESHADLASFNKALLKLACDWIGDEDAFFSLQKLKTEEPERALQIKSELERRVNTEYSIFDTLFHLGHNTIFLF